MHRLKSLLIICLTTLCITSAFNVKVFADITPYEGPFTGLDASLSGGVTYREVLESILMPAYKCYLYSGMSIACTVGQKGAESGWKNSDLCTEAHNYWGMKCVKGDAGHDVTHTASSLWTDRSNSTDRYRAYPSADLAFLDRPYFFWESSFYPHIKAKLEAGECDTWQSMLDESTESDWSSYCSDTYRSYVTNIIKGSTMAIYKLDDEAYTVGLLIHLGLYKEGDPIMIQGKAYYPGEKHNYTGSYFDLNGNLHGSAGELLSTAGSRGNSSSSSGYEEEEDEQKVNWMPIKKQISYEEWLAMEDAKEILSEGRYKQISSALRVPGIIFGVLLMLYGILLILAYWVDIYNNFFSFSLTEFLTFGKCNALSPDMYKQNGAWTETGKRNIAVQHVITRTGLCWVTGAFFVNINNVYQFLYSLYYYVQYITSSAF